MLTFLSPLENFRGALHLAVSSRRCSPSWFALRNLVPLTVFRVDRSILKHPLPLAPQKWRETYQAEHGLLKKCYFGGGGGGGSSFLSKACVEPFDFRTFSALYSSSTTWFPSLYSGVPTTFYLLPCIPSSGFDFFHHKQVVIEFSLN